MLPDSWPALHAALTHFPVALLVGGVAFDVGALLRRKPEWRIVSFWMLAMAVALSIPSLFTGWVTGVKLYNPQAQLPPVFVWHRALAFLSSGLALVLLLWRIRARDYENTAKVRGRVAMTILSLVVAGAVGATGHYGGQMVFGDAANGPAALFAITANAQDSDATATKPPAKTPLSTRSPGFVMLDAALVKQGTKVYADQSCAACHQINGKGGKSGPVLTHIGSEGKSVEWHIAHLKNPSSKHPKSSMPAYDYLSPKDLKALSTYMVSLK
ncbi:MAG TPA: DUF2231 domain-containing protein [Abditibacteriaceae bacterium]|jgi:mono/diheme cytochrome c family protein|nr:DUF2231 domain-containing protein [Abditibacteriaceae bacterium]